MIYLNHFNLLILNLVLKELMFKKNDFSYEGRTTALIYYSKYQLNIKHFFKKHKKANLFKDKILKTKIKKYVRKFKINLFKGKFFKDYDLTLSRFRSFFFSLLKIFNLNWYIINKGISYFKGCCTNLVIFFPSLVI